MSSRFLLVWKQSGVLGNQTKTEEFDDVAAAEAFINKDDDSLTRRFGFRLYPLLGEPVRPTTKTEVPDEAPEPNGARACGGVVHRAFRTHMYPGTPVVKPTVTLILEEDTALRTIDVVKVCGGIVSRYVAKVDPEKPLSGLLAITGLVPRGHVVKLHVSPGFDWKRLVSLMLHQGMTTGDVTTVTTWVI